MSELKVYKASAGSGKTYRLAGEYLDLIIQNPNCYKNILAVTFTNKASAEMKSRILNELYDISIGKTTGYNQDLMSKHRISELELQQKAKEALYLILHDFSKFSIETIDSFFQKIILSFVREIGLQTGYSVELDIETVLIEVINNLLFDLDNNKELTMWLTSYAESKIEEGKTWNVKYDILNLGYEIFKESFKISKKKILKKTENIEFLKNYMNTLFAWQQAIQSKLVKSGREALDIMKSYDLETTDFKQGQKGVGGFFEKISGGDVPDKPNTYVINCCDSEEEWYSKKSSKQLEIRNAIQGGLMRILDQVIRIFTKEIPVYKSIDLIYSQIPVLGLITDLTKRIYEFTNDNNSFLISDAAEFLFQITGQNDSPFIYEKTGTYVKHFMIDEFQDTSKLQWHNFRPLILNSMSENNNVLLVGDVKQSIYRWRNSDWKILAEDLKNEFQAFRYNENELLENWRSSKYITTFNNFLFSSLSEKVQNLYNQSFDEYNTEQMNQRIHNVYKNLEQKIPLKNEGLNGYVEINFFEKEIFREKSKKVLIENLVLLSDCGYFQRDIAIIVRNKKDGKEIADYIMNYNQLPGSKYFFDVISNDSLYISSNASIQLILACFRYMRQPENVLNLFMLAEIYLNYLSEESTDKFNELIKQEISSSNIFKILPKGLDDEIRKYRKLSIFEATENLIIFLELNKSSSNHPYLQAFMDIVLEFSQNKTMHLNSFLDWWDLNGTGKTIRMNDDQNAIKIVTIHKSKGLQYKAVFVPFCNWSLDHEPFMKNILWCKTEVNPLDELEIVPVRYNSKLKDTIFSEQYFEEKLNTYVDNLNLLYVTFTRPEQFLFVNCEYDVASKVQKICDIILEVLNEKKTESSDLWNWDKEKMKLISGSIEKNVDEKESSPKKMDFSFISTSLFERFNFTRQADDYFQISHEGENKINYGNLMHEIFQSLYTADDVEKTLHKHVSDGKLTMIEYEEMKRKIMTALQSVEDKKWFSGMYKVKNEHEIYEKSGKIYRPDRVMHNDNEIIIVDYKFGEKMEPLYQRQVKKYMQLVSEIYNQSTIKGFIWYVDLGQVKSVE